MENLFFNNWQSTLRIFIMTILAYISMVLILRVSGKRTLSKMNAFDFVVTVALGSSLATVALNKSIALLDGALAFFLLVFLQFGITWLSVRVKIIKRLVTSQPVLLFYKDEFIGNRLKKERITIEEIYLTAREKGISELNEVDAIILETTGDITIIPKISSIHAQTLTDLENKHKVS